MKSLRLDNWASTAARLVQTGYLDPVEFFYSEAAGVVYGEIPKAASTSIKRCLLEAEGVSDAERMSSEAVHREAGELQVYAPSDVPESTYMFTFLREPLSRFMSTYLDKIVRSCEETRRNHFEVSRVSVRIAAYLAAAKPSRSIGSIEEFAQWCSRIPDRLGDRHIRSQAATVRHREFSGSFTFVGVMEEIGHQWKEVQRHTGLGPLHKSNEMRGEKGVMVDSDTALMIRRRYADDFELYAHFKNLSA